MYYVITAGRYSDYHIVGITDDKTLAEEYVNKHNKGLEEKDADWDYEYYGLEEYADLKDRIRLKLKVYSVAKYKKDGLVGVVQLDDEYRTSINRVQNSGQFLIVHVYATDEDKAKKIGLDLINVYEAEQAGIV